MIIPNHKPLILDIYASYTHKLNVSRIVILYFICQRRLNWLFEQDDSCLNSEAVAQAVTLNEIEREEKSEHSDPQRTKVPSY